MFVLSSGLSASGVVHAMGRLIARVRQPLPMTMLVLLLVGVLSAFINNTAAVAVFLPVVLATTAANRIPASQLLIPMSYAAQMPRSEEHTSELQSLMRISYAVFILKKKT